MVGPQLGRPHADSVKGSRHSNMKELRIKRKQMRVLFAFDPRRAAILLIGGAKQGDRRFYERLIPVADALFGRHLKGLRDD